MFYHYRRIILVSLSFDQNAYTDIGSADKLAKQGLGLRNTANKTMPYWLLPNLTAHALKVSSCPNTSYFYHVLYALLG